MNCYDTNGNVTHVKVLDDSNSSPDAEYGPDSFGNMATMTGNESSRNPFRFSTKYTDDETELVYYGYRYYSPELGRWINRDPIGERGSHNLSAVCRNNCVDHGDTLGQWIFDSGPSPEDRCEEAKARLLAMYPDLDRLLAHDDCAMDNVLEDIQCKERGPTDPPDAYGGYHGGEASIYLEPEYSVDDYFRHMLHELQHAFQDCGGHCILADDCKARLCHELEAYFCELVYPQESPDPWYRLFGTRWTDLMLAAWGSAEEYCCDDAKYAEPGEDVIETKTEAMSYMEKACKPSIGPWTCWQDMYKYIDW